MKTVILKVALIAALGALVPASLAFVVNAQTTETPDVTEDIVSVTENEDGTETAVSGTGDDEASYDVTGCYVISDDSEDDTVNTGLSFVVGYSEFDEDDTDFDDCMTLTSEDADTLAKEKLTDEEYARWQELNSQIEASGGGEISDDLINEMTELMIKFTDSDAKWHGCCYTVNADESSLNFDGSISVSDEN
ncbi:MAG: hypothetical protein ILP22_10845 [Oscillospiraceae bacterium]|nr:hypothetical protein [Oscillospiraceae bacterium]